MERTHAGRAKLSEGTSEVATQAVLCLVPPCRGGLLRSTSLALRSASLSKKGLPGAGCSLFALELILIGPAERRAVARGYARLRPRATNSRTTRGQRGIV